MKLANYRLNIYYHKIYTFIRIFNVHLFLNLLGVIATSIMIIVISCRLRVMRNRNRKGGKQSYAHDADFLINGMYL